MNFRLIVPNFRLIVPISSLFLSGAVYAAQPTVKFGIGGYISDGDYGLRENTEVAAIPLSVAYRSWPWKVKLSTTLVHLEGPGTLSDGDIGNDRDDVIRDEQGFGDTSLKFEREGLLGGDSQGYWSLGLRVKVPTGDEGKGLGTGEFDYEPRFTLMYLKSDLKPYLLGRYTIKGDSDEQELENTFGATLGLDYTIDKTFSVGTQLTARESSIDGGNDRLETLIMGKVKFDRVWSSNAYLIRGLASGSPDWALGFTINYKWRP